MACGRGWGSCRSGAFHSSLEFKCGTVAAEVFSPSGGTVAGNWLRARCKSLELWLQVETAGLLWLMGKRVAPRGGQERMADVGGTPAASGGQMRLQPDYGF